jgi:hypothetical protein
MGLKVRSDAAPHSPRAADPPTWPSSDFEPRPCSLSRRKGLNECRWASKCGRTPPRIPLVPPTHPRDRHPTFEGPNECRWGSKCRRDATSPKRSRGPGQASAVPRRSSARRHRIRPSFVRAASSQPNPNEATTARPPTSSAFAVAGSGRGRAAMARVRSTGTCSMYAA